MDALITTRVDPKVSICGFGKDPFQIERYAAGGGVVGPEIAAAGICDGSCHVAVAARQMPSSGVGGIAKYGRSVFKVFDALSQPKVALSYTFEQ